MYSLNEEPQSELGVELAKLTEKVNTEFDQFKQILPKDIGYKRPIGGKNYQHIKSKYKMSKNLELSTEEKDSKTRNRRLRPSSACSSPTKMGETYGRIEEIRPNRNKKLKLTIGNIGIKTKNNTTINGVHPEQEMAMFDFSDSSNQGKICLDNSFITYKLWLNM